MVQKEGFIENIGSLLRVNLNIGGGEKEEWPSWSFHLKRGRPLLAEPLGLYQCSLPFFRGR